MPFEIKENFDHRHRPDCPQCWASYPRRCECGGYIHAELADIDDQSGAQLYTKCDLCGKEDVQ